MAKNENLSSTVRKRIERIFSNGSYYAYGEAFKSMFHFSDAVVSREAHLPSMTFAFHVRHDWTRPLMAPDVRLHTMVNTASSMVTLGQSCTAFIASDRREAVNEFLNSPFPCKKYALHPKTGEVDSGTHRKGRRDLGANPGLVPLADRGLPPDLCSTQPPALQGTPGRGGAS